MDNKYLSKLNILTKNYEYLRKEAKWENDLVKHLVALDFTMKGKKINIVEIMDLKKYIKNKTGIFSPYRGEMMFALAGLLCSNSDMPKKQFDKMIEKEIILKEVGFKKTSFLPMAVYALMKVYEGENVKGFCKKAMSIYKEMKIDHPFLTGGDDYALSILLAETKHGSSELEEYYRKLNQNGFYKGNGLQMLSHILSISKNQVDYDVKRCEKIYEYLKENKMKIGTTYYPALGILTLLEIDESKLLKESFEISMYLKSQKRYKWLGKGMNVMIAAAIMASEYIYEKSNDTVIDAAMSVSVQVIIAAEQAAMIAAITASTANST